MVSPKMGPGAVSSVKDWARAGLCGFPQVCHSTMWAVEGGQWDKAIWIRENPG